MAKAQISVTSNFPHSVAPQATLNIDVKIGKAKNTGFSKYQMDVPDGLIVSEVNSKGGHFTFEAGRAKIVWVSLPEQEEFFITLKFTQSAGEGSKTIQHKFFYIENGTKKEFEPEPIQFSVEPSGASSVASIRPANDPAVLPEPEKPAEVTPQVAVTPTLAVVQQTVDHAEVAKAKEQKKAWVDKLHAMSEPVTNASPTENKEKTQEKPVNPVPTEQQPKEPVKEAQITKTETPKETPPVKESAERSPAPVVSEKITYRIQLGAFGVMPEKSKFKNVGKVEVLQEAGMYKAYHGDFASKEEAVKRLSELKSQGQDGFVVTFKNGQKAK